MNKKKYNVLICGAGWVSKQHIHAYKNNPYATIVGITSWTKEEAEQRARESKLTEVTCFDDLEKAITRTDADIVSICTPQHIHFQNAMTAIKHGKSVVIEKPAATNMAELRELQAAAQAAGIKTIVSFVLRWNPLFIALKRMLADGVVGTPYCVETDYMSYNGSWWSGWNDARTIEQGVSALLVGGCHAVDALRWFASTEEFGAANPVEVFGYSGGSRKGTSQEYNPLTNEWINDAPPMEYDGLEMLLVKFDNGVLGKISVNAECVMPYRFPVRIFGNQGTIFDNKAWSSSKYPTQTDWIELPTILPDSSDVSHHPFQGEIDYFIDCLQKDICPHCSLEDAIKTHQIVFAAQECYRTGRPVTIDSKSNHR